MGVSNLRWQLTDSLRRIGGNIGYGIRPSARRKGYAKEILRQTLLKARVKNLSKVLITCDCENVGSARAILGNGGQLDSEERLEPEGITVQRYLIQI